MRLITALIFAALISSVAKADLVHPDPKNLCETLKGSGLATRGWKNQYDDKFGCSSAYKDIGAGSPLPNNIAYYVEGTSGKVELAKIVLNVNDKKNAPTAHGELGKVAAILIERCTGQAAPPDLVKAIQDGKVTNRKIAKTEIRIEKDLWPTGKGYEIKVIAQ